MWKRSTHICFDDRCLTHMWDFAHSERITVLWCKHREQEKACAWLGQFKWVYQTHIQNRFIFAQPENQPQTQLIWTFIIMLQIFNIYCTTTKFVFSKYLHTGIRDSPKKLRIRRILALTKYIILLRSAVFRCYVWFSVCLPHITSIWRTFGVWICIFVDNFKSWRISVTCFDWNYIWCIESNTLRSQMHVFCHISVYIEHFRKSAVSSLLQHWHRM